MHYINGNLYQDKGKAFASYNPANGETIWQGTMAQQATIDFAFEAAQSAFLNWSHNTFDKRVEILRRFVEKVQEKSAALATLLSQETGKPLWEAQAELSGLSSKLTLSIQAYQERTRAFILEEAIQTLSLKFKPLGVVCVLGAFNLPVHLSHGHIIPALLAGNVVIYKPSELTPAISQAIMACWQESGLPKGVLNLVQGNHHTAQRLLTGPLKALYFTGSYKAGLAIQKKLQPQILVALEMGGNNPLIIDTTKHIDAAIYNALLSCFITTGQRCSCARRLMLPHNAFGDLFLEKFIEAAKKIKIGSYTDTPEPFIGPVITVEASKKHLHAQSERLAQGANALLTMRAMGHAFLSPGILEANAPLADEEIFAPLVTLYRYHTFEEAVTLANQTEYGLTAGLFSDSPTRFQYFYENSQAGVIAWNRPTTGGSARLPFGGTGKSGNHRPSAYFAADYVTYPVSQITQPTLTLPDIMHPGIIL